MAHGNAILDHADEEGHQPLLGQYHEDIGALILTFFDTRLQQLVTVHTHAGAEGFLRRAADLVDKDTGELQRIRHLEDQIERYKIALDDFHRPLKAWAELNQQQLKNDVAWERRNNRIPHTPHDFLIYILDQMNQSDFKEVSLLLAAQSRESETPLETLGRIIWGENDCYRSLNFEERSLYTELMALLGRYQDHTGHELAPHTLKRLITQTEDITALRELVKTQERDLNVQRENANSLTQVWGDCSTALKEAQELLAELNQVLLGFPPQDILVRLREYVRSRGILAPSEIPF
ncbi:MAG: hypothetical protein J0I12_11285 [Candidatus Eremiobacteraeota bacterium]|nr:hypothetical protein [Candidatus Eremiobacteraeota bacterium]